MTASARAALVRISDAYLAHQPLTRFDVGQPGHAVRPMHQKALHEAGLIHLGTAGWPDRLVPTDAGRRIVRDLALDAGDPDPYPDLAPPQEISVTMTPTDLIEEDADTAEPAELLALSIPLADLHPRPNNLRVDDDGTDLVHSIVRHGILEPLNVSPRDEGGYWINAGHRRLDGARRAGLLFAPCIISSIDGDRDVTFTMLIENLQRRDLNPIEEARGFQRLVDLGCNQAEIAEHTGISASVVSRRLKLLTLPDTAIERIAGGGLSLELAEAYAKLDPEVAEIAVSAGWEAGRVQDALDKATRQQKATRLKALLEEACIAEIPYSRVGKFLVGSDTHKASQDGVVAEPVTLEALQEAAEPNDVLGFAIHQHDTYGTDVPVVIVTKKKASQYEIDQRARQQERAASPDGPTEPGPAQAAAEARRRANRLLEARIEHTLRWFDSLADRKWKAADVTHLLAVAAVFMLGNETPNTDQVLLGEPGGFGLEASDRLIESLDGLAGAALHKAMAAIAADLLGYDLYQLPDGALLTVMERFGFEQLPDDHPVDLEG